MLTYVLRMLTCADVYVATYATYADVTLDTSTCDYVIYAMTGKGKAHLTCDYVHNIHTLYVQ